MKYASRLFTSALFALVLSLVSWVNAPAAHAVYAPELLPSEPTAVIDMGNVLTSVQEQQLSSKLTDFEDETGWKVRVLTQFDQTPGRAVKDFWGLNDKSVLMVADSRGGNILNFNVGDAVYPLLPRVFWVELQTRYGNQFFVRDNGEDQAILSAIDAIQTCLRGGGCAVVPGLPHEQWVLTLVCAIAGGVIFGFAGHPRKPDQIFAWQWALIFSPLWAMLFIAFGLGPVLTRTSEWLPIFRNIAGFCGGALIAYLIPVRSGPVAPPAES
ncbi:TPM domain-containing protein [Leptolyngbya sp. FACHB-261]|uniref:TPM domain-containing protein n=1 Tax=Leptolyngbya sp. FACHB-261 TaxID=2692806 RepID=UPI00168A360F|nr:TPM domain-containing protein [Leptolyngbya sp. FACHB-261]MBD2099715.1 TPM domain-containing protein [Leptolyngbya sp. FACHB-261]